LAAEALLALQEAFVAEVIGVNIVIDKWHDEPAKSARAQRQQPTDKEPFEVASVQRNEPANKKRGPRESDGCLSNLARAWIVEGEY
jgi:hypothetical protein